MSYEWFRFAIRWLTVLEYKEVKNLKHITYHSNSAYYLIKNNNKNNVSHCEHSEAIQNDKTHNNIFRIQQYRNDKNTFHESGNTNKALRF